MVTWKTKISSSNPTSNAEYGGETIDSILDYHNDVDLSSAGADPNGFSKVATPTYYRSDALRLWDISQTHYVKFQTPEWTENHTITFPSESALPTTDEILLKDTPATIRFKTIDLNDNTVLNLPNQSGIIDSGTLVANGNTAIYNIPHGMTPAPDFANVDAASNDARGDFKFTIDSTNIVVTYTSATPAGTNNISLSWFAGYINVASAGFTPTSVDVLENKTIDRLLNTIKNVAITASYTILKDVSTYYAINNRTGAIVSSGTTDASVQINAAINDIPTSNTHIGNRIFIAAAQYECKTTITIDTDVHAVELVGEGPGTFLNFSPAGALTNGIDIRITFPALRDMRIRGNANVTNLVKAGSSGTSIYHDSGDMSRVIFDGTNVATILELPGDDPTITSGQIGLLISGTASTDAHYFWRIHECDFRALDIGIKCLDYNSTSTHQTNNVFRMCETGILIHSGQHNISNIWCQGAPTVGLYGIRFTTGATGVPAIQHLVNIQCELMKTGAIGVLNETGANVRISNVFNSGNGISYVNKYFTEVHGGSIDYEKEFLWLPTQGSASGGANGRYVGSIRGHCGAGVADGILQGNVVDFGPTITSIATVDGATRYLSTGSTVNTLCGMTYTKDNILRSANPEVICRIYNNTTTAERIFIGLTQLHTAPTSASDFLNARNGVGLWIDTAVSTDWKVMHNDGAGASTVAALSTPTAISNASNSIVRITTDDSNSSFVVRLNGVETTVNTNIPATGVDLGFMVYIENTAAADKAMRLYYLVMRSAK